jgi:hypothetical protein
MWRTVALISLVACAAHDDDEVLLSGRIQLDPESTEPVANAFVRITDSNKSRRCFVTACDGTFTVRKGDVPQLVLPLADISIERVDAPLEPAGLTRTLVTSQMKGGVRDQRSCTGCHAGGVSLFRSADAVPPELRGTSAICAPAGEIVCPEDRIVDDQLDLVRDFATYEERVHAVFVRRCSGCHAKDDAWSGFEWVRDHDGVALMEQARSHGGVQDGDFSDQCLADWLGVPRAPSRVKVTHADACRRAAE